MSLKRHLELVSLVKVTLLDALVLQHFSLFTKKTRKEQANKLIKQMIKILNALILQRFSLCNWPSLVQKTRNKQNTLSWLPLFSALLSIWSWGLVVHCRFINQHIRHLIFVAGTFKPCAAAMCSPCLVSNIWPPRLHPQSACVLYLLCPLSAPCVMRFIFVVCPVCHAFVRSPSVRTLCLRPREVFAMATPGTLRGLFLWIIIILSLEDWK